MPNRAFPNEFPSQEVKALLGIPGREFGPKEDTHFDWGLIAYWQLEELVKIGALDPDERQNYGPTIKKIMAWVEATQNQDLVELEGYVIFPPRRDARASVDAILVAFPGLEAIKKIIVDCPEIYNFGRHLPTIKKLLIAAKEDLTIFEQVKALIRAFPKADEEELVHDAHRRLAVRLWWD